MRRSAIVTPGGGHRRGPPAVRRRQIVGWALLGLACLIAALSLRDAWSQTGRPYPGFGVLENLIVGIGGLERGGLEPFDITRVMDGRVLTSGREIQAAVRSSPPGTPFHYILNRGSRLVEVDVPSVVRTVRDFERYLLEGFVTAILFLALGAFVLWLEPGVPETSLFLAFCLTWFCIPAPTSTPTRPIGSRRSFSPPSRWCRRCPSTLRSPFPSGGASCGATPALVWLPYGLSALIVPSLVGWIPPASPDWLLLVPAFATVYWGAALILLVVSLGRTSLGGATPLLRQRARVLMLGFAVGQLLPVLGTTTEAIFRVSVPHLNLLWRLNILFPLAVAYAMVRYDLFDLRAVIRTGTIYGVVTTLVALAYAGVITLLDIAFAALGVGAGSVVSAFILALVVVLLLNPIYGRTQKVVDRVFFLRAPRHPAIPREPVRQHDDDARPRRHRDTDPRGHRRFLPPRAPVPPRARSRARDLPGDRRRRGLRRADPARRLRARPLSRGRARVPHAGAARGLLDLAEHRAGAQADLDELGVSLIMPILFRGSVTGIFALGDKLSGAAYSTFDLRVLRLVANQSSVAIENARAYTALQQANTELRHALRRVEILESIRANLSKFVPATVQRLIEEAPESPELDKRDVDVSCALRRHRGLYPVGRTAGLESRERARRALLRRLPRRNLAVRGRRERDGG